MAFATSCSPALGHHSAAHAAFQNLGLNCRTSGLRKLAGAGRPAAGERNLLVLRSKFAKNSQRMVARASSSTADHDADASSDEESSNVVLGPEGLQTFLEANAGKWKGSFIQFNFDGTPVNVIPTTLTASTYGKGDLCSLQQTLRIQPGPQGSAEGDEQGPAYESSDQWAEYRLPEVNRILVNNRLQVGYFEDDNSYAISHLTAEMLSHTLRVGLLGEDADEEDTPKGVKMPSDRPALVSEICLQSPSQPSQRARAFHVLDPRGLIDTIAVFVEGQESSPTGELLQSEMTVTQLLGEWTGTAKVLRSDLYGATSEEQDVRTVYSFGPDSALVVASTRGGRTLQQKAAAAAHSLKFDGGLQTVLLPGALFVSYPQVVPRGTSFYFEFGWLSHDARSRQRIVRTFDPDGMVVSTTLIKESKVTV